MMTHWKSFLFFAVAIVTVWTYQGVQAADTVNLASDGKTGHVIVKPESPSPVDDFAAETLANYLKQMTGADFAVVAPADLGADQPAIFVGVSEPALRRLCEEDPLTNLEDQEHVCRNEGQDVFLYGKGIHGQLWAVMEFLENSLGWRWYTPLEDPVVPSKPTITLEPFNRKKGFSFKYRQMQALFNGEFYYLHGMNMGWKDRDPKSAFKSDMPTTRFTHTLLGYIPSKPDDRDANAFEWQTKKNYFETNPEFFTLNKQGKRVANKQLCFGNKALRAELTKNILKDIAHAKKKGWGKMYVTVTAADTGGRFCHCDDCVALEKKYQSNGGPLLDYVIELCGILKEKYPEVMVKTSAYRRSQTQDPPVLPDGETLPDNLIISFAPIEDCFFADWWNHRDPMIQDAYEDLLNWGKIVNHLACWIYPSPSGTGVNMPVGVVDRITNNFRLMNVAGVEFIFADHVTILSRSNFAELQRYLMFKLMKDVDCDADAVIKEFTDHHYGAAGSLIRKYLDELEQCRIDMDLPPSIGEGSYGVTYKSHAYDDRTFPYLTVENIHRWQTYFDEMEKLTADQPKTLLHVQAERRELDLATLLKWLELKKAHPDYFNDPQVVADRIRATNAKVSARQFARPLGKSAMDEFLFNIKVGGEGAPVPERFADVDPKRIRQYIPRQHWKKSPQIVEAPDAALGYAAPVHRPDNPLKFGFYDKKNKKHGPKRELAVKDVTPGKYELHELGEFTATPDCMIWFSAKSWQTQLQLGAHLYEPGADNRWKAYVSMKFDGPTYGGEAKEDQVLVDRVILVSMSEDQFKEQ